jgi:hypothetical protein
MASRIYYLKQDQSLIMIDVKPVTIGIASTVVQLKKSGGTVVNLGDSSSDATGSIHHLPVGISSDLVNTVLVVTSVINLIHLPPDQWDSVFEQLRITYRVTGGMDRSQDFNLDNDDKIRLMEHQIIAATKAIKFILHEAP